jgi:hypothetical protein
MIALIVVQPCHSRVPQQLFAIFNAAVLDRLVASSARDQDRDSARRGRADRTR